MNHLFESSGVRMATVAVATLFALGGIVACDSDDNGKESLGGSSSPSASTDDLVTSSPRSTNSDIDGDDDDTPSDPATTSSSDDDDAWDTESATPESTKTAYDEGECLSGTINTDGGEQEELDSVKCSDTTADFKVLAVYPYSMGATSPCTNVSGTDYTYSSYMTRNGIPTYGSTYCLSQLG